MEYIKSGIYVIENLVNGKKYIGQGFDVKKRMMTNHRECLVVFNAINYYGEENFKRFILDYCEKEILNELEIFYIDKFCSHVSRWGYNVSFGGNSPMRGREHTDEWKRDMSEKMMGEKNHNYGKKLPPLSLEARKKISDFQKGRKIGKKRTPETLEKMRIASTGRIPNQETRKKISDKIKGKNNPNYEKFGKESSRFGTKLSNASSQYFGVHKIIANKKYVYWQVEIRENNKRNYLGNFKKEIDAAKIYDKYVVENNIDRPLNFPETMGW